jgi:2'-5' RNA ligase
MPRLFTGLEIPEDIAFDLNLMQGGVWGARWIEPADYHITLRFIGDIEERLANEIGYLLERVASAPFTIRLKGVGAFGGSEPREIHAKVAESVELRRLQNAHEKLCQTLGLAAEGRKFTPHVTLARLRGADMGEVQAFIARQNLLHTRPFEVGRFVLFSSRPSRGGGPYGVVQSFDLEAAARAGGADARPSQR